MDTIRRGASSVRPKTVSSPGCRGCGGGWRLTLHLRGVRCGKESCLTDRNRVQTQASKPATSSKCSSIGLTLRIEACGEKTLDRVLRSTTTLRLDGSGAFSARPRHVPTWGSLFIVQPGRHLTRQTLLRGRAPSRSGRWKGAIGGGRMGC